MDGPLADLFGFGQTLAPLAEVVEFLVGQTLKSDERLPTD
jgi:hypothetical protein